MDNLSYQSLKDVVANSDRIAIAVGKNPTVDDMAGALALYLVFQKMGKNPSIASATQPLVEHSNLIGIDKVTPQFEGGNGDLTVAFPYREGEIEKVSYNIDNGFLNIVVKAGRNGLTFQEQDIRYVRGGSAPSTLFIVGTPRLTDLGELYNPESLKDAKIVNIDNKADNQRFGDVVIVSPEASSVSEVVAEAIFSLGVTLDQDTAQNLLNGLMQATKNLMDSRTSPQAFEVTGRLLKSGAKRSMQAPEEQNEERVSSFMPEQSLSGMGSMNQSRPRPQLRNQPPRENSVAQKPPSDWLTPKVYKGSSDV